MACLLNLTYSFILLFFTGCFGFRSTPRINTDLPSLEGMSAADYCYAFGAALVIIGVIALWTPLKTHALHALGAGMSLIVTGHFLAYLESHWYLFMFLAVCGFALVQYRDVISKKIREYVEKTKTYDRMPPE